MFRIIREETEEVMKLTEGRKFNIATVNSAPDKVIGKHGFGPHKAKLKKDI